jgi:hypothetical protein
VTVAGLTIGLLLANRERAIAQTRFLEVRQLANKLFDIDALASQLPGNTKTRQLIVDTSLEYLRRLAGDARRDRPWRWSSVMRTFKWRGFRRRNRTKSWPGRAGQPEFAGCGRVDPVCARGATA